MHLVSNGAASKRVKYQDAIELRNSNEEENARALTAAEIERRAPIAAHVKLLPAAPSIASLVDATDSPLKSESLSRF